MGIIRMVLTFLKAYLTSRAYGPSALAAAPWPTCSSG